MRNLVCPIKVSSLILLLPVVVACDARVDTSKTWNRHTIDNSSLGADGARTADVNGDGLPDIVTGWEQGGVSRIYLMEREEGSLPNWIQVDAGPAPSVEDALLVDLDQDGAIDVVSSTEGQNMKMLVHWAPPPGSDYTDSSLWKTETLFEDGSRWMFAVRMDIDGKNGPDLVIAGKGKGGTIGWLESPANPRHISQWKFHPLTPITWIMSVILEDVDADGLLDVLVSDRKGKQDGVFWLKNPGKGSVDLRNPWEKNWIADDLYETNFIALHDFNSDGNKEVVVPHKKGDKQGLLSILEHEKGVLQRRISINLPASLSVPKAVSVADINLDGKMDAILSTEGATDGRSGVVWLSYSKSWDSPDWKAHDISGPEGIKFDLNLMLDLDDDGDLDVINTEEANNARGGKAGLGLIWYENPYK